MFNIAVLKEFKIVMFNNDLFFAFTFCIKITTRL